MENLMVVEIYENNGWKIKKFEDITIGSLFRLRNPNTGELHEYKNSTVFKSTSIPKPNKDGILYVDIDE